MFYNKQIKDKILIFTLIQISLCSNYLLAQQDLATIAFKEGTDKMTAHNYIPTYDFYFSPLRNQPLKFLEIGFLVGHSARMWDTYFSNAILHFIDISPELFEKYSAGLSSRCHLHVADQGNRDDLLTFIQTAGGDFDIILDDGGHTMQQQITSFKTLFPYVKKGGMYIIEDLHTSYWTGFGGSGSVGNPKTNEKSTIRFLQSLVDDVNFIGATTGYADQNKCSGDIKRTLTYYQEHIKSIHFYSSLCFILKN